MLVHDTGVPWLTYTPIYINKIKGNKVSVKIKINFFRSDYFTIVTLEVILQKNPY